MRPPTAPLPTGRSRGASPIVRRRAAPAALTAFTLLAAAACASTDATGPDPAPDQEPTVAGVAMTADAKTYLRARLKGAASDPEGEMDDVVVDWGDGTTATLTQDFDAISMNHDFPEVGSYTVTVTATDAAGNRVSDQATVKFEEIPKPCIDIKVVTGCATIHPDMKGLTVEVSVFGVKLNRFTLSTTNTHVELPIVSPVLDGLKLYPYGRFAVDVSLSRTKGASRIRMYVIGCKVIGGCTETSLDHTLSW